MAPRILLKLLLVLGGLAAIGAGYYFMGAMPAEAEYGRVIQLAMRSVGLIIAGGAVSVAALVFIR